MKSISLFLSLWLTSFPCIGAKVHVKANNDYMTTLNPTIVNTWLNNTNFISISIWVKFQSLDIVDTMEITAKAHPAFEGIGLFDIRNNLQKFEFYYFNPDSTLQLWSTTAAYVQTNTWMHIGCTFTYGTGSSLKFYVDGVSVAGSWVNGTGNVLGLTNSKAFHIASNDPSGSPYLNGVSGETALWNTILSSSEMFSLAKGKISGLPYDIQPSHLLLYVPQNDASDGKTLAPRGNITTDFGGHAIDLDAGGTWVTEKVCSYPPNE